MPSPERSVSVDQHAVRILIRRKLADARLPQDLPRVTGGPGSGQTCVGCDLPIPADHYAIQSIGDAKAIELHTGCFYYWDAERTRPAREGASAASA
jgi:hypothetical protein